MGLRIVKTNPSLRQYRNCTEIKVGTLFSDELIAISEQYKEYDNHRAYSGSFFMTYSGIMDCGKSTRHLE